MNIVLQPRSALTGTVGQRSNLLLKFLAQFPLNLIGGGLVKVNYVGGNLEVRVDLGDITAALGTTLQPNDGDLTAISALAGTGIAVRTAADTWALRTLTAPAAGLTIANPAGIAGNPTFAFANDLGAVEALTGTGFPERTGIDTWALTGFTGTGVVVRQNAPSFTGGYTISTGQGLAVGGVFGNNAMSVVTGSLGELMVQGNGTGCAAMAFHRPSVFAGYIGLDTDSHWKIGGWSHGANAYRLWHDNIPFIQPKSASPAQITADQNDYNPTGLGTSAYGDAQWLRLSSDATRNLTGLAGGVHGRMLVVHNVGATNAIVLKDESVSSAAANRFALTADVTLVADAVALLQYDNTSQRWRMVGGSGSGGGGAATTEAYVTIGNTAGLSAERALTAGAGIAITDNGVNSTVVVSAANGAVLQCLQTTYTANTGLATVIPNDDTIPQSTEGVQILSQAITPADNTNKILCIVQFWGRAGGGTSFAMIGALFRGTTCINAISVDANGVIMGASMALLDSPASAAAQTYSVRVGPDTGSDLRLNGSNSARLFGGASACTLTVMEIAA